MEDLVHMRLISSDPVISSLRSQRPKKNAKLPEEVVLLLKIQDPENTENYEDSDAEIIDSD